MCIELAGPISASLRPGNTAPFEETLQWWQAVGNTVSYLTGPRFEPQTCRSRDERVTARPTGHATSISCTQLRTRFDSYVSFHLTIAGISFKESVHPENWPEGVLVKRFYAKSTAVDDSPSKSGNTPTTNSKV